MPKMPVLFVGHGSPMNAIEENPHVEAWCELGKILPRPKAILAVSAHWFTNGTLVCDTAQPKTIYDMYGFPDELYRITYPAPGAPAVAARVQELLKEKVSVDNSWGFDHGSWSVLHRMFPEANIPLLQLSVDRKATMEQHFAIGQALAPLRDEGVLIFASGNVVHNLRQVGWSMKGGFAWAEEFDGHIKRNILEQNYDAVVQYTQAGDCARQAVPTADHFAPLLYVLGASAANDSVTVFNDDCVMGSLSMTSYLFA